MGNRNTSRKRILRVRLYSPPSQILTCKLLRVKVVRNTVTGVCVRLSAEAPAQARLQRIVQLLHTYATKRPLYRSQPKTPTSCPCTNRTDMHLVRAMFRTGTVHIMKKEKVRAKKEKLAIKKVRQRRGRFYTGG